MPVENVKSNLIQERPALPADPALQGGSLVKKVGRVSNAADASSGSSYHLCNVPSNGIVDEATDFDVQGWGFAQVVIGTETDTDALLDVTRASGNNQNPFAPGDASHGRTWWEVLGYASDPGGEIALYAHAEAAATAAGEMLFKIAYLTEVK
ncbi:MAG: hypothetical protein AAF582_00140 [Pseudomonadota bacterium]